MNRTIEERLEALEEARFSVRNPDVTHDTPHRPIFLTWDDAHREYLMERSYGPSRYKNSHRIYDHSTIPPTDVTKGPLR